MLFMMFVAVMISSSFCTVRYIRAVNDDCFVTHFFTFMADYSQPIISSIYSLHYYFFAVG